jgi:hypothetical protein
MEQQPNTGLVKAEGRFQIFTPTMKLRWSKEILYDGGLNAMTRELQQCFLDQDGNEYWFDVEIEKQN